MGGDISADLSPVPLLWAIGGTTGLVEKAEVVALQSAPAVNLWVLRAPSALELLKSITGVLGDKTGGRDARGVPIGVFHAEYTAFLVIFEVKLGEETAPKLGKSSKLDIEIVGEVSIPLPPGLVH